MSPKLTYRHLTPRRRSYKASVVHLSRFNCCDHQRCFVPEECLGNEITLRDIPATDHGISAAE